MAMARPKPQVMWLSDAAASPIKELLAKSEKPIARVRTAAAPGWPIRWEYAECVEPAGCDVVLHCNGRLDEMQTVAAAVPRLEGEARRRARAALSWARRASAIDLAAARAEFADMIASDPEAHAAKMQVTS